MLKKALGFSKTVDTDEKKGEMTRFELLSELQPDDLVKYGLIPEFVGRLPVAAALEDLDEESLVRILQEPKNSLIKQYEQMFKFDDVKLTFTNSALKAVAKKALTRKTGARGLRSILEESMMEIMYSIPSEEGIQECIINEDVISEGAKPILMYENKKETA